MSGPRLAVIGDAHVQLPRLERVLRRIEEVGVEGILLVGDLGNDAVGRRGRDPERVRRYQRSVDTVLELVRALGLPLLWVPGNHDLPEAEGEGKVDRRLATLAGLRVVGIGGAGPARFGFPYEWDEAEIRALELPACELLLVHCPPARCGLDRTAHGEHVGSEAIRERAEAHRGLLVCGHIHEAPGVEWIGDCLCVNAGGLGEPFGAARVAFTEGLDRAWVEDLDSARVWRSTPRE